MCDSSASSNLGEGCPRAWFAAAVVSTLLASAAGCGPGAGVGGAAGASYNTRINMLPNQIPNAKVVSASGLAGTDQYHFDLAGQRQFGMRYGQAMMSALGL